MQTNKKLFVFMLLNCLIGFSLATLKGVILPSMQILEDAERVLASWDNFMSFKATEQAMKRIVAKAESLPDSQLQMMKTMLSYNQFDREKCDAVKDKIVNDMNEYSDLRANVLPYLWVCKERQTMYCANTGSDFKPEDIVTETSANNGLLAYAEKDDSDECDARCLAEKLELEPFDDTEQVRELLKSATFRQALRVVNALDEEYLSQSHFVPAMRQALVELEQIEKRDGLLDGSLRNMKDEYASLLDVCTPTPTKCATVFDEFSKILSMDYEDLESRVSKRFYAEDCLNKMKYYCSYFE